MTRVNVEYILSLIVLSLPGILIVLGMVYIKLYKRKDFKLLTWSVVVTLIQMLITFFLVEFSAVYY